MKHFVKVTLLVILGVFPQLTTKSSTNVIKSENILFEVRKKAKILEIEKKIEKEYELFNFYISTKPKRVQNFVNDIMHDAVEGKALPSIVISQAAIETGFGRSKKLGNNIFGIKGRGHNVYTKEFIKGKYVTIRSNFQHFKTLGDAMDRHYQIINRNNFETRDYVEWAHKIKRGGYATDPKYAYKLIKVIEDFDLDRLDRIQELYQEIEEVKKNNVMVIKPN